MSQANTTAQSAACPKHFKTLQNLPKLSLQQSSNENPTLALFSSGEDEFGNEGAGVLSPSLQSSEGSLSPPQGNMPPVQP